MQLVRSSGEHCEVMHGVPTPPGVNPIKWGYVYKTKYTIKMYKARLISKVRYRVFDIFNTFAHVVKSVTVCLLLALAFIFNMHVLRAERVSGMLEIV